MENPFYEEQPILGSRILLVTEDNEFRMSLWVRGFGLKDATTDEWLLELNRSLSLEHWEEVEQTLYARFKIFPDGSRNYEVILDPFNRTFTYNGKIAALKEFSAMFQQSR